MSVEEKSLPAERFLWVNTEVKPNLDPEFIEEYNFYFDRTWGRNLRDFPELPELKDGGGSRSGGVATVMEFDEGEHLLAIGPWAWGNDYIEINGDNFSRELLNIGEYGETFHRLDRRAIRGIIDRAGGTGHLTSVVKVPRCTITKYSFHNGKGFCLFVATPSRPRPEPAAMFLNGYAREYLREESAALAT